MASEKEPASVWEGTPERTHKSYADTPTNTTVSIVSSDGVEFLVAEYYLKAHR